MKDALNAAVCVGLLVLGLLTVPTIRGLLIYTLFPGALAFYLVQDNPHGGTIAQMVLGGILFFVVNIGIYALIFAGARRVWNNAQKRGPVDSR